MKLKESCEKALDEIEILEFELEDAENLVQRLEGTSQIVKKLFLLDVLKLMQPFETELSKTDLNEFRSFYKEIAARTDAVVESIRNSNRLNCDDICLYILDRMLPYFKVDIKSIYFYSKSKQIQIVA